MADNVSITAGSGTTIATDEAGSAHYQKIKLVDGTTDSQVMIFAGGGVESAALRVTIASDSTGVLSVDDNGGSLTVDGTVAATQSGTWNITNISGTVSLPTGAATAAKQPALGTAGTASADVITIQGVASMTAVQVADNGGSITVDNGGTFAVQATCTNAGTFAVQVDGAALTALQLIDNLVLAEDAIHGSGDPGVQALAVRKDTAAALAADGDYVPLETDANGRLHVIEPSAATTATNTGNAATSLGVMDDWDNAASDGASVSGDVAHDTADAGEPVKIGAKAETAPSGNTPVSDGDRTDVYADSDGILLTKPAASGADSLSEAVSNTDGASTAFSNFAAVANVKNAVTSITAFRTDSGTTLIYIDFRDGTAGSVIYRVPLPAGGGVTINAGGFPLFKTSANTALAYDVSAATSTVYISLSGFKTRV